MFGAAIARHLAPYANVTVVGPGARADGPGGYGAHHDEGRIIGDLSRDPVWSELNRRARDGMTELDPALITWCGALTATTRDGPGCLSVAAIALGTVRALHTSATGTEAQLDDGRRLRAEAAIVASGAFAAGSDLLPVRAALRAKSEVYVMAELDDQQAAGLDAMPCINRMIGHPMLSDLYVLPPIRYPDGRTYLKFGANTMIDHWLPDPAAVRAWYDHGDDDAPLPALRETLTDLLPDVRIRSWHTRRCADAYTAHRHPYIDILEPGRLIIALGGNGRGAQAADAIGYLTAHLALTGQWQSGLPRDAFRHVPADGPWNGMTMLRDQAR
jgi:hypothetical protein